MSQPTSSLETSGGAILLVEDSDDDAYIFRRALQAARIDRQLLRVGNGDEAIRYLSGEPPFGDRSAHPLPSLIVLDLKMPIKNGFDVLEWLRSQPNLSSIPVIVLTASDWEKDQQRVQQFKIAGYFLKPVGFDEMVHAVQRIPNLR